MSLYRPKSPSTVLQSGIFVEEWMRGFDPQCTASEKLGASGDMGRDVVGYFGTVATNREWDNYQCKHYAKPLVPSDIWIELGKMCFYFLEGAFCATKRNTVSVVQDVADASRVSKSRMNCARV